MGYCAIVDYGVGNLMSVSNALNFVGVETRITGDTQEIRRASSILLPGVGAFPDAANKLRLTGLDKVLLEESEKKPMLGICLGMQLLFEQGEEVRPTDGLGLIPGSVQKIETQCKLPHIGWTSLDFHEESPLFAGLDEGCYVYFVHSFCGHATHSEHVIATTQYGPDVVAAVQRGMVFGTQFHPEKSGEVGLTMLKNFGEISK